MGFKFLRHALGSNYLFDFRICGLEGSVPSPIAARPGRRLLTFKGHRPPGLGTRTRREIEPESKTSAPARGPEEPGVEASMHYEKYRTIYAEVIKRLHGCPAAYDGKKTPIGNYSS